jgi:hypothetical protein
MKNLLPSIDYSFSFIEQNIGLRAQCMHCHGYFVKIVKDYININNMQIVRFTLLVFVLSGSWYYLEMVS